MSSGDRGGRHGGETGRLRIYSSCCCVYLSMRKTLEDPLRPVRGVKRRRVVLGPADPNRVDVGNPVEVRWWCRELDVSSHELRTAVETVGPDLAFVRKALTEITGRPPGKR